MKMFLRAIGSFLFLILAFPIHAEGLGEKILNLKSVKVATVVLVPRSVSFRAKLEEQALLQLGCTYRTENPQLIEDLQHTLQSHDLKYDAADNTQYDLRYGVYFTMPDGSIHKLLFGESLSDRSLVGGSYSISHESKVSLFHAAKDLPDALFAWSKSVELFHTTPDSQGNCGN